MRYKTRHIKAAAGMVCEGCAKRRARRQSCAQAAPARSAMAARSGSDSQRGRARLSASSARDMPPLKMLRGAAAKNHMPAALKRRGASQVARARGKGARRERRAGGAAVGAAAGEAAERGCAARDVEVRCSAPYGSYRHGRTARGTQSAARRAPLRVSVAAAAARYIRSARRARASHNSCAVLRYAAAARHTYTMVVPPMARRTALCGALRCIREVLLKLRALRRGSGTVRALRKV